MTNCSVTGCDAATSVETTLYDVYPDGTVFFERDHTCPFLCQDHVRENEESLRGERRPRALLAYKYINQNGAQGFTIYRPLNRRRADLST